MPGTNDHRPKRKHKKKRNKSGKQQSPGVIPPLSTSRATSTCGTSPSVAPKRAFDVNVVYAEQYTFVGQLVLPESVMVPFDSEAARNVWDMVRGVVTKQYGTCGMPFEAIKLDAVIPGLGDVIKPKSLKEFLDENGIFSIVVPEAHMNPHSLYSSLQSSMKVSETLLLENTSLSQTLHTVEGELSQLRNKCNDCGLVSSLEGELKEKATELDGYEDKFNKCLEEIAKLNNENKKRTAEIAELKDNHKKEVHSLWDEVKQLKERVALLPQYDALNLCAEIFTVTLTEVATQILPPGLTDPIPNCLAFLVFLFLLIVQISIGHTVYRADEATFKAKWTEVFSLPVCVFESLMLKKQKRNAQWHECIFYNARETIMTSTITEAEKTYILQLFDAISPKLREQGKL